MCDEVVNFNLKHNDYLMVQSFTGVACGDKSLQTSQLPTESNGEHRGNAIPKYPKIARVLVVARLVTTPHTQICVCEYLVAYQRS